MRAATEVAAPHLYTPADGAAYARRVALYNLLLYAHFGLGLAGVVPLWTLCLSAPVLVVRWMLALHELFHLRRPEQVDPFNALLPLAITPLFIGYREYRDIHLRHHAYMATPRDPDYFHIRGTPLRGLANAFTAPEQIFFRWLVNHRPDTRFAFGVLVRLLLFAALLGVSGWAFLWYWLPLRLAHGLAYFAFFYCLHRRGPDYGVYPLPLPRALQSGLALLFGRDAVTATCHHDVHHRHTGIAARHLSSYGTLD